MPLIACGAPLMLQGFAIFWYPLHKQGLNLFERDFQPHNYSSSKKHLKNSILRLQPNTFASQAGELHALKEPRWRRPLASTVLWKAPPPTDVGLDEYLHHQKIMYARIRGSDVDICVSFSWFVCCSFDPATVGFLHRHGLRVHCAGLWILIMVGARIPVACVGNDMLQGW